MGTPAFSDVTTQGFRVGATGYFMPEESDPAHDEYVFGYRILIVNQSNRPATLVSRHWTIIDADGQARQVQGPGVIGQTPHLMPGQAFKYSSFCPLSTPWGTMEGHYRMKDDDGQLFDIAVARFYLVQDKLDSATPPETPDTPEAPEAPEAPTGLATSGDATQGISHPEATPELTPENTPEAPESPPGPSQPPGSSRRPSRKP